MLIPGFNFFFGSIILNSPVINLIYWDTELS